MDWQPPATIPHKTKVRIKTATGMERIAICMGGVGRDGRAPCFSRDRKTTGDLRAVGWLPLEGKIDGREDRMKISKKSLDAATHALCKAMGYNYEWWGMGFRAAMRQALETYERERS